MSLFCGGTIANYVERTALPASTSYPCWIGAWLKPWRSMDYATVYAPVITEATTGQANANGIIIFRNCPWAYTASADVGAEAISAEALITEPVWDHVLVVFESATSRKVYINGILEGTNTTSLTPNFGVGSPKTRIGARANSASTQAYFGYVSDVTFGTGIPSSADRATLATPGISYSGVAGVANWYTLADSSTGNTDQVGGANMSSVGTPAWAPTIVPTARTTGTRAAFNSWVFGSSSLPATTPTVTTGVANGWGILAPGSNNIGSIEQFDFSANIGDNVYNPYVSRAFHLIPASGSQNHLVLWDGGHETPSQDSTFHSSVGVTALTNAGYAVLWTYAPGYSGLDSVSLAGGFTSHDQFWTAYMSGSTSPLWTPSSFNPLRRWLWPIAAYFNNLASRYAKISVSGLSGGGWQAVRVGAMDARVNHAIVPCRGTIASRRYVGTVDFEQHPYPNGMPTEDLYLLCAQGNRRVWFDHHPTDTCCFRQLDAGDGSGGNYGSYINAATYDAAFLQPMRLQSGDVKFFEEGVTAGVPSPGATTVAAHSVTSWFTTNVLLPALSTALPAAPNNLFRRTLYNRSASRGVA